MAVYKERILFADENELFCEGLLKNLKCQNIFEIIDVASDWFEILSKTKKLLPDIIILNIRIMHSDWIEVSRQIRQLFPSTTIMVLSENRQNMKEALNAGVNAFIVNNLPFQEILKIVGSVTEKSSLVFPVEVPQEKSGGNRKELEESILSKREKEILVLLGKGFQNKEIAYELSIQIPTVNNHLQKIFRKLGCYNRTEAVLAAMKKGVIVRNERS